MEEEQKNTAIGVIWNFEAVKEMN